jgi:uncharacterized protein YbjT (DUF2867 family)
VLWATGVQGSPVPIQLKQRKRDVRVIVRDANKANEFGEKGIEVVTGDLLDSDSSRLTSEGMDAIFLCYHWFMMKN